MAQGHYNNKVEIKAVCIYVRVCVWVRMWAREFNQYNINEGGVRPGQAAAEAHGHLIYILVLYWWWWVAGWWSLLVLSVPCLLFLCSACFLPSSVRVYRVYLLYTCVGVRVGVSQKYERCHAGKAGAA